ncbi:MAG: 50S ribosomal protein L22 [Acidobacteriota bacterium]|nr:50S ribosomal protein L22 [Acidobacteriota bacterium]
MEASATAKFVKGSPQKARLVIDLIRGRKVEAALDILRFSGRRAARSISKVLRSAIANAEQKEPMVDVDDLFVKEAFVDLGPTKWRFRTRPVPMGRAFRERRRQSHITIRVSDGES